MATSQAGVPDSSNADSADTPGHSQASGPQLGYNTPVTMTSFLITPPEPFAFANPNDWPTWKKRFLRYHTASGLSDRPEASQVDTLVYLMGTQAEEVFNTFKLSDDEQKKFDLVLSKFDAYFIPRRNIIFERARFNTRIQQDGESVEDFVTALHALAETCN